MIYFLILFLIVLFLISFMLTRKDLLSPWVISCGMFLISALFVVPNIDIWNVDLKLKTIMVIFLGLCSFGFGELIIRKLYKTKLREMNYESTYKEDVYRKPININILILLLSIILMSVVTFFYYKQVLQFAYAAGYSSSTNLPMLRFARIATTTTNISELVNTNKFLGQGVILSFSYAYLMLYALLYNLIFAKFKKYYLLYTIPIIIYLIQIILSGGRTQFIYLVGATLLISAILYQIKTGWSNKKNLKYIKVGLITFSLMLIVFYLLGNFTGKTTKLNLLDTISIYTGSSIVAFDIFLQNNINGLSTSFGQNTLFGVYDILAKFGFQVPNLTKQASFVNFGNYETNVYTSYMRYIKDFTMLGLIFIEVTLGMFYTLFYLNIRIMNRPSIVIVVYAIVFQTIIECAIEERFFMNILSLGYLVRIGYLILLYLIVVKMKKNNVN